MIIGCVGVERVWVCCIAGLVENRVISHLHLYENMTTVSCEISL